MREMEKRLAGRSAAFGLFALVWVVLAGAMLTVHILSVVERHWVPWTLTIVGVGATALFFAFICGRASMGGHRAPERPRGGLYIPPEPQPELPQLTQQQVYRVVSPAGLLMHDTRPKGDTSW